MIHYSAISKICCCWLSIYQSAWYHLHRYELCNDLIQLLVRMFSFKLEYISHDSISTKGWSRVTGPTSSSDSTVLEIGSHSSVPVTFLSQGIEILQISHHGKFWSVSRLHLRIGIPWIPVHNWPRSFLRSLAWALSFSFSKCVPMLGNQRLIGVRYWVWPP